MGVREDVRGRLKCNTIISTGTKEKKGGCR